MTIHISPLLGILVVLAALGALFVGIRIAGARTGLHPEVARKALHVGMGLICLTLPALFAEAWPVITLGILASVTLLVLRLLPALRSSLGSVLHGVERASLGEFYFITGVTALFVVSHNHPLFYVLPMMWLTFADATAALIGVRYGTIRYDTHDGKKSIEGSIAFANVAFTTTFIALVAFGYTNALTDVLLSAIVGLLTMMLEAVAWNGIDNLLIPIFGYALLRTTIANGPLDLAIKLAVLLAMFGFVHLNRKRSTIEEDGLLAAVLSGYAFWILGGWMWIIAPLTLFLKDKFQSSPVDEERRHDVHAVMATCGVGLAFAALNAIRPGHDWFFLYTVAFTVQASIFDLTLLVHQNPKIHPVNAIFRAAIVAYVLVFLPYLPLHGAHISPVTFAVAPALLVANWIFYRIQPLKPECPRDVPRWLRQTAIAGFAAVALGLAVLL